MEKKNETWKGEKENENRKKRDKTENKGKMDIKIGEEGIEKER